ncbi:MAG: hypothetical protein JO317_08670 [Verrucomicrobiae bacterium]|nr:hypothetical protein [Verrucomicrobiae bacterium]
MNAFLMWLFVGKIAAAAAGLALLYAWLAVVVIREREVGIVVKKFAANRLAPGRLIALHGEAGYQADTLAPGVHLNLWRWQYRVTKVPAIAIAQGEIGLIMAADGSPISTGRILARAVECDNFQDGREDRLTLFPEWG